MVYKSYFNTITRNSLHPFPYIPTYGHLSTHIDGVFKMNFWVHPPDDSHKQRVEYMSRSWFNSPNVCRILSNAASIRGDI